MFMYMSIDRINEANEANHSVAMSRSFSRRVLYDRFAGRRATIGRGALEGSRFFATTVIDFLDNAFVAPVLPAIP